jgi:hypothetical protein
MLLRTGFSGAIAATLFAQAILAQTAGNTGEISGVVRDPSAAAVANAAVTLTNPETGFSRRTSTDQSGAFRFPVLPPAAYDIRVEKDGFKAQVAQGVRVTLGQVAEIALTLEVGALNQVIEVAGTTTLIESERTQQSNTLEREFVQNLPIDRRDYLTFSLLAPGVVDSKGMADNSDFRVTQTPNSGLSFFGSNGRGNSITVDGGEANEAAGAVRPTLSQEAVEEFQVSRSNYTAELGFASGGVINIVSKSGTNDLHGSMFGYFRTQQLDATDPFNSVLENGQLVRRKPDANRQQYGGSMGGPLKRDKTFVFWAFEGLRRNENNAVVVLTDRSIFNPTPEQERILSQLPPPNAAALRAALTAPPATRQLFEQNSGIFPFRTNDYKFSVRLDHNFSGKDQFQARYNFTDSEESNANTRALVGASRASDVSTRDNTVIGGWTRIASPSVVNELRVQYNRYKFGVKSIDAIGPELNIAGFGFFNRDIFLPFQSTSSRTEIKDNVGLFRGNHRIKFGGMALIRANNENSATFFAGRFNFGSLPGGLVNPALAPTTITALQAFNLGLPQAYQQGFGDPVVSATYPFYGVFVQDSWKVNSRFTLDLGVRYDVDTRKSPLPTDKNNVAPRFGFAWDPAGDGKTLIRGGYGIFFAPIYFQIDYVVNALGVIGGFRQIPQVLTTIQTPGAASAANIYQTLRRQGVIGVPTPIRTIQPDDLRQFGITVSQTGPVPPFTVLFENSSDYVNPYSQQASFSIERQITRNFSLSAAYTYAHTLKITRARDKNLLEAPVDPRLGIRVWRPQDFANPLLFQFNVYESTANAFYSGLILEAKKRFSNRFSLAANYTFSRATDEVTDFNSDFQPFDQTNLRNERALSAFDQRHKLVVYGVWSAPLGLQFSPVFRANSGRPFNLLVGSDINQDRHSTTDRPPGAGRNTGRGPSFITMDLRLAKRFHLGNDRRYLELTAEAFNLTNRLNYASVNNTVGMMAAPFHVSARHDRTPSEPLGFTSAFDPRRLQLGVRFMF